MVGMEENSFSLLSGNQQVLSKTGRKEGRKEGREKGQKKRGKKQVI